MKRSAWFLGVIGICVLGILSIRFFVLKTPLGPLVLLNPISSSVPTLPQLIIYTYDSFLSPGGLGPTIFPLFEKKHQCHIRALSVGDAGSILTRLILDERRGKPTAQLAVGIDQNVWEEGRERFESWDRWLPQGYSQLKKDFQIGSGFLPYDYGIFALMADRQNFESLSLQDLIQPKWKRNIILEDPRVSTPGLAFLLYTQAVLGSSVWLFWKELKKQWLTLTPGWDTAYGLFLKEEAPLVWSYTTSQAYHEEHGDRPDSKRRYRAILFQEGQPYQVEGAALVKGNFKSEQEKELAREFLEFLISPEVQAHISSSLDVARARRSGYSYQF